MKVRININDRVRVKLTEHGRDLVSKHDGLAFERFKVDADGRIETQLWCLMQAFGPHLYMGGQIPFETEIEVVAQS